MLLTVFRKTRMREEREVQRARRAMARCVAQQHTPDEDDGSAPMAERSGWQEVRGRRMAEPGAAESYAATRLAFELGKSVREMREQRGWTQAQLAEAAGMTQSTVARFEAGGTVPTIPVLDRLAQALGAKLVVKLAA